MSPKRSVMVEIIIQIILMVKIIILLTFVLCNNGFGTKFERGQDMENDERIYRQAVADEILRREGVMLVRKCVESVSENQDIKKKIVMPELKYILRFLFVAVHFNMGGLFVIILALCLPYPYSWLYLPYFLCMLAVQIIFLLSLLEKSSFWKKYW